MSSSDAVIMSDDAGQDEIIFDDDGKAVGVVMKLKTDAKTAAREAAKAEADARLMMAKIANKARPKRKKLMNPRPRRVGQIMLTYEIPPFQPFADILHCLLGLPVVQTLLKGARTAFCGAFKAFLEGGGVLPQVLEGVAAD